MSLPPVRYSLALPGVLIENEQRVSLGAFRKKARNPKGVQKQNFLLVSLEDSRGESGASFAQGTSVPTDVSPGFKMRKQ